MKKLFTALLLIYIFAFAGCGKEENHEHPGSSDPELEPLAYTLYSDKTELFVEFKPLIVGEESKFAAHFTHTGEFFKPYTSGTITLRLKTDGKEISTVSNSPSSPGIFRLALTPEEQGNAQLVFNIQTDMFLDEIIIENLQVYPNEEEAFFAQKNETSGDEVTYLKEQSWKVDFATKEVNLQPFNQIIKTSGQITSAPGDESMIVSKSQGVVSLNRNNGTIGSPVSSGELMFSVIGSDVVEGNIDVKFKELKLIYEKALADFERGNELIKDNIISQKEFLERETALRNAEILYDNISRNYSGDGENVYSPMTGYIKDIYVTEGQFVTVGQQLGSITKNKKLLLTAEVSQQYFSKLGSFTSANFRTEYDNAVYKTEDLNGMLVSYGKTTGKNNFYVPVNFEIDNRGNLISGSFVQVFLISKEIKNVLVIPISALIEEQGLFYVFVQTAGESFQKREVKTGISDGLNIEILTGIENGERVVVKGAYNIKLAAMSGTIPAHGHEH